MKFKQNDTVVKFDLLNYEINELYRNIAAKQGLSDSAYAILQSLLILNEGCSQTEICKHTLINKQTINSSVKKLLRDDLIYYKSGLGREMKLYLTKKGAKIVEQKIIPIERLESEVFEEMSEEDQLNLLRIVELYLTSFKSKIKNMLDE